MSGMTRGQCRAAVAIAAVTLGAAMWAKGGTVRADQVREVAVTGDQFAFLPARIEVQRDDLVRVTFHAGDVAHSFTIDAYRIAKRAEAGQTVTFEFRADTPGTHRIYCNLSNDDGCRRMHGELVVRAR